MTFFPLFGSLYWFTTWRQLFHFDLDRPVIDLSWKVAHGVLYTAQRLSSFGYDIPLSCFCSAPCEPLQHLVFDCLLAVSILSWFQSLLFCASPLPPSILVRHVLFGFSGDELRVVPRVFVYLLNVCKFCIWWARNDFRFRRVRPSAVDVVDRFKARLCFHLPLFFRRFSSDRRRRFLSVTGGLPFALKIKKTTVYKNIAISEMYIIYMYNCRKETKARWTHITYTIVAITFSFLHICLF